MDQVKISVGIWGLITYFSKPSLDEMKRVLEGETECLSAKILDISSLTSSTQARRGKKRKQEDCPWMTEGQSLVVKSRCLLGLVGGWRSLPLGAKTRWEVYKLVYALKDHDTKGNRVLKEALSDARGLCRGYHIPVKQLVGRVASSTFDYLKVLLEGGGAGRIAIYGMEGIGKTFLMKHLHNYALKRFDYVFWVSFPDMFTIKHLQDAVAAAVNCDLTGADHLFVGIPVPANGSECKLVLSTRSSLEYKLFDCFQTVEVKRLPEEDAYKLFMREANIREGSSCSFDGIPRSLADRCSGVPRRIVNIATRMCGIDDPHEWKSALFE
ncbi:probable disease resistance protein At1g52660 isoform X2 [Beta vulgaris subsp. vulgaris]|uniref:probable disease resistance protein At1g52660 isoform X2 n=1 Tax=Beta vulgaris subsp. vulgaris TaxID=3555 RepID=UPI00053F79DD|nr:probable disease resistance protein At1g52660 isoform X2 [Beta vulgaris subsp. vulgaris]